MMNKLFELIKKYFWFILLVTIAFISYQILNFPSGSYYCYQGKCGYYFWGSQSHDGIWHLAIAENAFKKLPFQMPTFAGSLLTGYNYLYDIGLFFLSKIGIPPIISYFKIVPIAWFVLFTFFLIKLAKKIKNNTLFIWLFLFFTYFTGSFSYYFTLIRDKTIWGSSGILAQLVQSILLNHQFALSLLPLLYVLIKMKEKSLSFKTVIILGLMVFINMGLKFYGGVITYSILMSYFLLNFKISPIDWTKKIIIVSLFFIVSILVFYNPFVSLKTGVIFSISPFTFIHAITEDPNLLNIQKLTTARYAYQASGQWLKLIPIEFINITLFVFFYLGVRFIGLIYLCVKVIKRKASNFDILVLITIFFSIALTSLLSQKGEWTNIVQFFYYGIFLSTLYIAEFAYKIFKKYQKIGYLLVGVLIILALPATIDIFALYARFPGTTYIPKGEIEALGVLKKMPEGIVYTPLYNIDEENIQKIKQLKEIGGPLPLYTWEDTAYITAFSGKQSYITDLWMERIIGIDYSSRLNKVMKKDCSILKEIDYIYFNNEYKISRSFFDCPNKLDFAYGNLTSTIYKVRK